MNNSDIIKIAMNETGLNQDTLLKILDCSHSFKEGFVVSKTIEPLDTLEAQLDPLLEHHKDLVCSKCIMPKQTIDEVINNPVIRQACLQSFYEFMKGKWKNNVD